MNDSNNIIQFPGNYKGKPLTINNPKRVNLHNAGVVKYSPPPKERKRKVVKNRLTQEHRAEIDYLVKRWVIISQEAKIERYRYNYGQAYKYLFTYGLDGAVNGIDQIEENEYEQCKNYLNQHIRIAESRMPKGMAFGDSKWRNRILGQIHARCKTLGCSEEKRKRYQLDRFEKESLADFTEDELVEMRNYVMGDNPTFIFKKKACVIQQDRENALLRLVGALEADAKAEAQIFNSHLLPFSKRKMMEKLKQQDPALFAGMSEDQFNKFWSKQQVCKLKPGKPTGSGTQ